MLLCGNSVVWQLEVARTVLCTPETYELQCRSGTESKEGDEFSQCSSPYSLCRVSITVTVSSEVLSRFYISQFQLSCTVTDNAAAVVSCFIKTRQLRLIEMTGGGHPCVCPSQGVQTFTN